MNHPTTKPREEHGISKISNITQWEENILKILVRIEYADRNTLLRGTLYNTEKLDQSLEQLQSKGLIEQIEDTENPVYQYSHN